MNELIVFFQSLIKPYSEEYKFKALSIKVVLIAKAINHHRHCLCLCALERVP